MNCVRVKGFCVACFMVSKPTNFMCTLDLACCVTVRDVDKDRSKAHVRRGEEQNQAV